MDVKDKTGILIFILLPFIGVLIAISGLNPGSMQLSLSASLSVLAALIIRWFRQDTIKRGHKDLLDRGMFLMTAGHIVLPLYLIWTRRLKGLLILLLALVSLIIPGAIIAIILHGWASEQLAARDRNRGSLSLAACKRFGMFWCKDQLSWVIMICAGKTVASSKPSLTAAAARELGRSAAHTKQQKQGYHRVIEVAETS
jgi:hypothetical protein